MLGNSLRRMQTVVMRHSWQHCHVPDTNTAFFSSCSSQPRTTFWPVHYGVGVAVTVKHATLLELQYEIKRSQTYTMADDAPK